MSVMEVMIMCLHFCLQRYYYYIHHGIDTEHVAPMEDAWLENVLSLVSDDLKVKVKFGGRSALSKLEQKNLYHFQAFLIILLNIKHIVSKEQ